MTCENCIHDGICANQDWNSYRENCSFYEPLRQKGEWMIEFNSGLVFYNHIKCSLCGHERVVKDFPDYCENCGARMNLWED